MHQFEVVRENIRRFQGNVHTNDIYKDPHRVANALVWFTAWHARIVETIVEYEIAYHTKLDEVLSREDVKSVAMAEVRAKTTKEYGEWQKAKGLEKSVTELIRSLKYWIRTREEEYKNS